MIAETSLEAYRQTPARELQRRELEVLEVVAYAQDGVTREECAAVLGWKEASVCGRANALVALGRLDESGPERKTKSGRSAKVLRMPKIQGTLFS